MTTRADTTYKEDVLAKEYPQVTKLVRNVIESGSFDIRSVIFGLGICLETYKEGFRALANDKEFYDNFMHTMDIQVKGTVSRTTRNMFEGALK